MTSLEYRLLSIVINQLMKCWTCRAQQRTIFGEQYVTDGPGHADGRDDGEESPAACSPGAHDHEEEVQRVAPGLAIDRAHGADRRDLARVRLANNVPGQALLAGFHEVPGPFVGQTLGDALPSAQLRNAVLPRTPSSTMRIFSSALYCLRVLRLMSRMIFSDDGRPVGLCFISTPHVRMNKNSLLNQNYICPMGADGVHCFTGTDKLTEVL